VHPDTFSDLRLDPAEITVEKGVYPTSSFRTVYCPQENSCYKLPLLRRITRGVRDLPARDLQRSQAASNLLSKHRFEGFEFLPEECHFSEDPSFNYIVRRMPKRDCFPWFYVIASQRFGREFELFAASQIIKSWMFFASRGLLLEFHTQNLLVDRNANIYYRDLSDVRSLGDAVLRPSYADNLECEGELLAAVFDRTVCKQNLDHLFRYSKKLGENDRIHLKQLIQSQTREYGLPFPCYSMDFPKESPERVPAKTSLVSWRMP
jgi:hypothetical protein